MADLEKVIATFERESLQRLDEKGIDDVHESEFPNMLVIIFLTCLGAAIIIGVCFLVIGNTTVTNIIGNHPQRY
jgi:hypothetical protein